MLPKFAIINPVILLCQLAICLALSYHLATVYERLGVQYVILNVPQLIGLWGFYFQYILIYRISDHIRARKNEVDVMGMFWGIFTIFSCLQLFTTADVLIFALKMVCKVYMICVISYVKSSR